jgi:hypothetical protein
MNDLIGENLPMKTIIALLKEYKEIGTLTFFVGGILWVFGYFATKEELRSFREASSNQNKILNCLLEKHVRLLEAKQTLRTSFEDLIAVQEEIRRQAPSGPQLLENDLRKLIKLEQQRDEIKSNMAIAEKDAAEANKSIIYRECEK